MQSLQAHGNSTGHSSHFEQRLDAISESRKKHDKTLSFLIFGHFDFIIFIQQHSFVMNTILCRFHSALFKLNEKPRERERRTMNGMSVSECEARRKNGDELARATEPDHHQSAARPSAFIYRHTHPIRRKSIKAEQCALHFTHKNLINLRLSRNFHLYLLLFKFAHVLSQFI